MLRDAFCGHTGLVEVARGLAGLQESLSDCKKPQEGTVLCLFFKFYTHTHVCVCISMYLETAWFLHFICGRSITTLFFVQVVPLNRGSLNTGNFFYLFLIVFCMLESWDYKIIVVTV